MSTYTTQQARVLTSLAEHTAIHRAVAECRSLVDAIINGVTSVSLYESADKLRAYAPASLREASSLVTTELATLPPVAVLPPSIAVDLSSLTSDISGAEALAPAERTRLVETMMPRLADLVDRVGVETGRVERITVAEGLSAGLGDLGYTLTAATGTYSSAIEASRGHEKVLVIVKDGGEVTTDWAGLRDGSCVDRQAELRAAAARHGIDLGDAKASLHHDPRGGLTIAAAARHHASSLAEGAVADADATHRAACKRAADKKPALRDRARA